MGIQRLSRILHYNKSRKAEEQGKLLDIGCAYGPFLQAGSELGFEVYGIDTAKDAVEYVVNELGFSAREASFPNEIPYHNERFKVVTMWYVIEHFSDLQSVMMSINRYLEIGGVFAFATPKGDGLSARNNLSAFLEKSPDDHYSIFTKKVLGSFLSRYGFELLHIETTGIHINRKWRNVDAKSMLGRGLTRMCKHLGLGDTFEIYARKKRDLS
nr:class I SAM-dependent methyltransferase [Entomospira entomophilus]